METVLKRNPILNPKVGDILKDTGGLFILVDEQTIHRVAFTRSDGLDGSFRYYNGWTEMTKDCSVIKIANPSDWPFTKLPTKQESLDYIKKNMITLNERHAS